MFSLDKLKVYDKALASAASLARHSRSWDKRHAVTDQLLRASESIVLNLAEGARLRSACGGFRACPERPHLRRASCVRWIMPARVWY